MSGSLPHDETAEKVLLASLLIAPGRIREVDCLGTDDFYASSHRSLFNALAGLEAEGITGQEAVIGYLSQGGNGAYDAAADLLSEGIATAADLSPHVRRIRESARERAFAVACARKDRGALRHLLVECVEGEDAAFRPTWYNCPPAPPPALSLNDTPIIAADGLSLLVALPGAGKTSLCEALCAARLGQSGDYLGFTVGTEGPVVLCDTEQPELRHWRSWARVFRRAGLKEGTDTGHFEYHSVKRMRAAKRRNHVERLIPGAGLLLVDGVSDLLRGGINDPNESVEIVDAFGALAAQHQTAILFVLHKNLPSANGSSDRARGWIGAELERKCESVLDLTSDREGVRRIQIRKNRSGAPTEAFFTWDDAADMFLTCDRPAESLPASTIKYERLSAVLRQSGSNAWSYVALVDAIRHAEDCQPGAAKKRVRGLQDRGLMRKQEDGFYVLA